MLRNLEKQFSSSGLAVNVKIAFGSGTNRNQVQAIVEDLGMRGVKPSDAGNFGRGPVVRLVAPNRAVTKEWPHLVGPGQIGLAVRLALGRPKYSLLSGGL